MTYSVNFKGIAADANGCANANTVLSDTQSQPGGQQLAMSTGQAFLCKGPDGAQALYKIDAERSTPGGPVYLIRQGP